MKNSNIDTANPVCLKRFIPGFTLTNLITQLFWINFVIQSHLIGLKWLSISAQKLSRKIRMLWENISEKEKSSSVSIPGAYCFPWKVKSLWKNTENSSDL